MTPGRYTKAWCVQNTGANAWQDVRLVYIGGKGVAPLGVKRSTSIVSSTDPVLPQECYVVQVDFTVPEISGKLFGFFKLEDAASGVRFGPKLWVFVNSTGTLNLNPAQNTLNPTQRPIAAAPAASSDAASASPLAIPARPTTAPNFEAWCDRLSNQVELIKAVGTIAPTLLDRKLAHYLLILHDLEIPRALYELKLIQGLLTNGAATTGANAPMGTKSSATATTLTSSSSTSTDSSAVDATSSPSSSAVNAGSLSMRVAAQLAASSNSSADAFAASGKDLSVTSFQMTLQRFQDYAQCYLPTFSESIRDSVVPGLIHRFVLKGNNILRDKRNFRDSELAPHVHTQPIQEPVLISFLVDELALLARQKFSELSTTGEALATDRKSVV